MVFRAFGLTFCFQPNPRIGCWTRFSLQPTLGDADALYPAVTVGGQLGSYALERASDIGLVLQPGLGAAASSAPSWKHNRLIASRSPTVSAQVRSQAVRGFLGLEFHRQAPDHPLRLGFRYTPDLPRNCYQNDTRL